MGGLQAARARKQTLGRPKGLGKEARQKAKAAAAMYRENTLSVQSICEHLRISIPTLYRYLKYEKVLLKAERPKVEVMKIS